MTVTTTNLIQGPANLWIGAFGAAEPLASGTPIALAAPASPTPWADAGATDGGIDLSVNVSFGVLKADQVVYEAERRRTGIVVEVKTVLAEATLINLAFALNNTAPSTGYFIPDDGIGAFNPVYQSVLFDGIAPGGFKRRFIGRKVLQTANMAMAYKKDGQTLIPCTFTLHWVSASIRPYIITDAGV